MAIHAALPPRELRVWRSAAAPPLRIVAVFAREMRQSLDVAMLDRDGDFADLAFDDRVFVDLHAEPAPAVLLDPLVEDVADAKDRELAFRQAVAELPVVSR